MPHHRDRDAEGAADRRQQQALGQQLADDAGAARADAQRTAISRRLAAARDSRRLAMFEQATSRIRPTIAIRT